MIGKKLLSKEFEEHSSLLRGFSNPNEVAVSD
jgi:hypothetical protein